MASGLFQGDAPRVASGAMVLPAGLAYVPPAGWYEYGGSLYVNLQRFDPVAQVWRFCGDDGRPVRFTFFDGQTLRIANPTGCVVAAIVTTAGTGYTSPPTVTASAGSASFTAIVGGAISTLATITAGGSGYLYPPLLWIENPPELGFQAGGYTTIANGTLSTVTILDQGAGYTYPPNVVILNDPRDTAGSGAQASVALTGAQTITGIAVTNWGNPITSGTVPTLSFSGGGGSSAAAIAVMDWCIQTVSITTPGAGYGNSAAVIASGAGGYASNTPAYLGGFSSIGMSRWRPAAVQVTTNSTGGLTVPTIIDAGRYSALPYPVIEGAGLISTAAVLALTMGGINSTIYLIPAQQ